MQKGKILKIIAIFFFLLCFLNPVFGSENSLAISAGIQEEVLQKKHGERIEVVIRLNPVEKRAAFQAQNIGRELATSTLKSKTRNSQSATKEDVLKRGGKIKNDFWAANAILAEIKVEDLEEIVQREDVQRVHENFEVTISHSFQKEEELSLEEIKKQSGEWSVTWGLERIGAPAAWDMGFRGAEDIKIAVLDTGVDITHPDLAGKMYTTNEEDPTYPGGWAEFNPAGNIVESEPYDSQYHGTHVSGTIVGGDGSGTYIGVAPEAKIMHGLVLPDGGGTFTQVTAGVQWAIESEADVINMSLGATGYESAWEEHVKNILEAGIFPVISIGNDDDGEGEGKISSPGAIYESFAIGASDSEDNIAGFSHGKVVDEHERGEEIPEEYIKPDFSAPGVSIKSALSDKHSYDYGYAEGTSMAAPHVAGAIALILQIDGNLTVKDVYNHLKNTADYYDAGDNLGDKKNTRYGYGIINVDKVIEEITDEAFFKVKEIRTNAPIVEGESLEVEADIKNTGDRKDTQDISLLNFEKTTVDTYENLTLSGGEEETVSLIWETEIGDAETSDIKVQSENDAVFEEVTVDVSENYFQVKIISTSEPVTEGGDLVIGAEITNTGTVEGTQPISLLDLDNNIVDTHENLTLQKNEEKTITLTWETNIGDADTGEIKVVSENDEATREVTIDGTDYFEVKNISTNVLITEGEVLEVNVDVKNIGSAEGIQDISLSNFEETTVDTYENLTLSGGEEETVSLIWETEIGDAGTSNIEVQSEDAEKTEEVTIRLSNESVNLESITTDKEEIYINREITFNAEIKNESDANGEYRAAFQVGKVGEEKDSVGEEVKSLNSEENKNFSFSHNIEEVGVYRVKIEGFEEPYSEFEVLEEPFFATMQADNVSYQETILQGEITKKGIETELDIFFEWRRSGESIYKETEKVTVENPQTEEGFSENLENLQNGETYFFRGVVSWEENGSTKENRADLKEFNTFSFPFVETNSATDVSHESGKLHGELAEMGMEENLKVYFQYREKSKEIWEETKKENLSEASNFSYDLKNLAEETVYEFRAVIEGWEEQSGEIVEFTTEEEPSPPSGGGGGGGGGSPRYNVEISSSDKEVGKVEGGGRYREGSEITIKAIPNKGYYFSRWEEEGRTVSREKIYEFTVESDRNLLAVFRKEDATPEISVDNIPQLKEEKERIEERIERVQKIKSVIDLFLGRVSEERKDIFNNFLKALEKQKEELQKEKEKREEKLQRALEIERIKVRKERVENLKKIIPVIAVKMTEERKEIFLNFTEILETMKEDLESRIEDLSFL